ncbi:MAG: hypothetical protein K2X82_07945, partial [Gemmataceae bacterium]|nr:hypothetical protein [Gemmataceae bacterium]
MTFEFLQGDTPVNPTAGDPFDTFRFKILGYAEAGTDEAPKLVIQGNPDGATFEERAALLGLTVKTGPTTKVDLDLSGKLTVAGGALGSKVFSESALGVDVAGRLTFNKPANKALEVFGALKLTFAAGLSGGPKFLKDAGLSASGSFLLGLNATPDAQDVELTLPGAEPVTITLDPKSLMLEVDGTLTLGASGPGPLSSLGAAVTFDGVAAFKLFVGQNGGVNVDVFVAGQLAVTATAAGKNLTLFSMQGLGLFALRDLGKETLANPIPKLAARVDLKASAGLPGVYEYAGSAQLLLNTTGQVFEYQIPDRLQERLAEIKAKAGMGPLALPAVEDADGNPKLVVQVPAAPPKVVASSPDPTAGPYFYVAFGDLDSERSGANTDPDDDGVVDVSLTVLSAFRLEGDMGLSVSAQGFQLAASARASLASDLVGNLFDARMSGLLTIDGTGLIGALAVTAGAQAPSLGVPGTSAAGSLTFYMGINTTQNNGTISVGSWTRPILKQSAEVYVAGSLALGGFEVDGSFRLFAGATAAGLEVDGKLSLFDLDIFTVRGDAAIYFPGAPGGAGLVINASVIVGNGGKIGVKDLFEIGGSLTLQLDTRAGGYAKVAANNLTITLLDAIEFRGSASITVVAGGDDPYTKLEGSFSADLFGAFSVRASGYFDSRGYFGLDLRGDLKLGSDDFGIQAGFTLFVDHPSDFDLDFGGSGYGRVRAFGITLAGASVGVDYASQADGGDGEIIAEASVTVIGITKSVNITLGYLILPQPIEPNLAYQDPATGALTLNVGDRGILRGVKPSSDSAEAYQIDALGPGIIPGTENVKVRAFGYSKVYYNVPSVGGNFGSRNDQLRVRPRKDGTPFLYALDVSGGGGDDLLINESDNPVTLRGGAGNDVLLGGGGADALFGDDDNDTLAGGAGVDALDGGAGNDELVWEAGRGVDQIAGGTGTDTLAVTGSDAAETFALGASGASVQVAATGGPANQTITAAGVEKVRVDGRAGADTVTVPAGVLAGIGVTAVDVDLSRVPTTPTATDKTSYAVNFQDDGSADTVEVTGTAAADTFTIDAVADAQAGDRVRLVGAGLTVGVVAPGATNDVLRVKGGAGNDTFTLAGPNDGPGFAGRRVKVQLQGEGDNDTAKMPVGGADFDGGTGQNTATFTVVTGDNTALTLNGTQVSAGNGQASAYAGLAEVGVEATVPVTLAVQATHANTTRLALAGGAVSVAGTSGALAITSAGNTAVTLAATGAGKATTFGRAGGSNGGDTLTVGVGLLSAVAGPVTATAIDTINYDDSQDGPNRTLTLTDAGLTGGGVGGALAHSGAKNLELRLGKGNDTANVAASTARVVVTDAGGSDAAVVTVSGNPANLGVRFDAAGTETLVTTSNTVEAVTFLNTGNTARTAWLLDQGRLAGGGRKLLDASATGVLALTLGDGGTKADPNTVTVLRTGQPTTLTARGSTAVTVGGESGNVTATLDEVDHPLGLFTSGSGTNTLILDDTRSAKQAGVDRLRTFARGSVTGPTNKQAATLTYDPAGYAAVTVNLGPADDAVTFTDPAGYATVSGGDGADRFTVSGAAGTTLAIAGGDGNDLLTLLPGANGTASGTVGFAGGAGTDSAVLDATALPTGRSGSFSGTVVAAAGVPSLNLTAPAEVEQVTVKLGGGNDTFDIATAAYAGTFALQGGGGDDAVTVKQLPANGAGQYQLDGQAGQDTVTLVVDGAPTAKQFFAVAPTAEELVVDNRTYSGKGTAPAVNWAVTGTAVTGNGVGVVSTLGADRLFVRGGKNAADAVTVQGTGAGPLEAEVDGDRVAAFEGLNVLTPSGGPVNTLTAPVAVDGLGGARSVATTSDGQWVYAAGVNEAAGVAVLRRTGSGGTTQLAYVGTVALPGGLAPSAVAVGTRSGQQYLYVTDVTGTAARFHTYRINTATGGLTLTDTRTVPGQPDALVRLVPVAPNGGDTVNVLAVEADGSGRELLNFAIDTGGNPTADPQRVTAGVPTSGGDPAVSPDGTRVYLPDAGGGRVAIYARADNGFLTYSNPPNTLTVDGGEQAQVAGNLLLVYSPAGQTITYYELSGAGAGSRPTRVAGTITGVTGGFVPAGAAAAGLRYRAFDYDPADGVLAVLTKSGVQTQVKTYKRSGTTFNPVSTANTPGTSFTEIAHRFGKVVVVAAYQPGEYASSGTVSVYPVSPAGTLGTRADDNFNFQSADNENGPVAVPTISVTTAAYDGGLTNNGGARTVFVVAVGTVADGGSNNSGEVTYRLYDPAAAGAPAAIPVPRPGGGFPLAAAGHPT